MNDFDDMMQQIYRNLEQFPPLPPENEHETLKPAYCLFVNKRSGVPYMLPMMGFVHSDIEYFKSLAEWDAGKPIRWVQTDEVTLNGYFVDDDSYTPYAIDRVGETL